MAPMVCNLSMGGLALTLSLLVSTLARGQDANARADRARLHFESGASYYEAGDYEDALREFERSFELSENATLFYNFSLCHQQLGEYTQAADYLERYLSEVAAIPNRGNLERRLDNLRERADHAMDEHARRPTEEPAPADKDPGLWGLSPLVLAGYGTGAVGAVVLGVFAALALDAKAGLDSDPCSLTRTCDAGPLRTRAILADVGLGLLLVGVIFGTTFFFLGDDDDDETARLELLPSVGTAGASASLRGSF